MRLKLSLLLLFLLAFSAFGQEGPNGNSMPFVQYPYQLGDKSFAEWIVPAGKEDEGVFYFRKKVELESVPEQFRVHVSANNRYRLYVNGQLVVWGPAAGDLYHWNYETVDLAPYLEKGENMVAAQVWNQGELKGQRQISRQTALILQGNSVVEQVLNTDQSWRVSRDEGHFFIGMNSTSVGGDRKRKYISKISYQEALFDSAGQKGNRDEWQGKSKKGYYDVILPDGGERVFEPLWVRVFRYVSLSIETGDDALHVEGIKNLFTAYPFEEEATFVSDQSILDPIWEASWRTARLCALETYMDCPYYEQVQYIGDTRIQALVSLCVSGDDRLVRNAIGQFYHSMQPMGLTQSRFPASGQQIIPPFLLYFILMVHLPYWNHIDGGANFRAGSPPGIDEGGSAHMSILLAYTMERAAELFSHSEDECSAKQYKESSLCLKEHTLELCYNREKGLIAETPHQEVYSQHTNIFAILSGMFEGQQALDVAEKILTDEEVIQTSLYFRFYLLEALYQVGMGNEILSQLDAWTEFLEQGLTTFPEHGLNSRSDCHAWSAHSMYDLLSMVCGIHPAEPGFKTVRIEPLLGDLTRVSGSMPHPQGMIEVSYSIKGGKMEAETVLPGKLEGVFIWKNHSFNLHPGRQVIRE